MAVQTRGADLRGLQALVAFLGVLVVLGTALVIGIVIHRLYDKPAVAAPAPIPGGTAAPAVLQAASGLLAHGEHIGGIAGAGGEVAIWVSGPEGDRVLLLDPVSGKLTVAVTSAPR